MAFLTENQIAQLGFKSVGKDLKISEFARIYNPGNIDLGSHIRIDDFAILSAGPGGISIGNYVHIACFSGLMGKERIRMDDFSGLSSRVFLYSSSDDYSGNSLTNPTTPEDLKTVHQAPVHLGRHVIIGTCATVLPGVTIGDGSAIGAYALVNADVSKGLIAAGQPAKEIKKRSDEIFQLERKLNP